MDKHAFGMMGNTGKPTFLDLLRKIQSDPALGFSERQQVVAHLRQEVGFVSPQTPLDELLPTMGGGALGYLVAKYFSMGGVGQALSTAAGLGIGRTVSNFYRASKNYFTGNHIGTFGNY